MGMFDFIKKMGDPEAAKVAAAKPGKPAKKKVSPKKKLTLKTKPQAKSKTKAARKAVKKPAKKNAKPAVKKPVAAKRKKSSGAPKTAPLPTQKIPPAGEEIGKIIHYFNKISVGIIRLKAELKVGDTIQIQGAHDDFKQTVTSLQFDHNAISSAGKGREVGIKVAQKVHENDRVYKLSQG